MSISIPIDDLTQDLRRTLIKDLTFKNEANNKWIDAYHVENDTVSIPYAFAREHLSLNPPPRNEYPQIPLEFGPNVQLREHQVSVKKEITQTLNKQGSCVLSLPTGHGKTMLSIYMACKLKLKVLIIINKLLLVPQWIESIERACPSSKVQFLKGKKSMDEKCDFYIINAQNVPKKDRGFFNCIGTLIVDEVHLICAQTLYKAMFHINPRYTIALSATPTRPDGLDKLIDLYFGTDRIIREMKRKHTVYQIQTGYELDYTLNWEGRIDWNSILTSQAEHPKRNQLIVEIVKFFPDRHFLILCKRVNQGFELHDRFTTEDIQSEVLMGTNQEYDPEARVIIATIQKGGTGFDCPSLDALIIAADVQEYFVQYLGRIFRKPDHHPIVFDLVDTHPILKRHWQTRRRTYLKSGGILKKLKKEFPTFNY
jgi:superfamily II DNA or RNA helicase